MLKYASVAQLDRALPSGGKGRWFKSNQMLQCNIFVPNIKKTITK